LRPSIARVNVQLDPRYAASSVCTCTLLKTIISIYYEQNFRVSL